MKTNCSQERNFTKKQTFESDKRKYVFRTTGTFLGPAFATTVLATIKAFYIIEYSKMYGSTRVCRPRAPCWMRMLSPCPGSPP